MRLPGILAQKKAVFLRKWNDFTHANPLQNRTAPVDTETERMRLLAVLEAAPVGIFLVDTEGKLILSNCECRRIWGDYDPTDSLADYGNWKGWWADGSEHHGERVAGNEWTLARCLAGEPAPRDIVEIEPFGNPGVRRTLALHAATVRTAAGERVGCVVAQMDITDQVRAEAALRESERKFRTIADTMPQMLWSTLPDGQYDYHNMQWAAFTGLDKGPTNRAEWEDIFHPEDRDRAWSLWQHCLETGEPYENQYRLRHHSGEYRWILGRALPVCDDAGRIIRWMGSCTDIHDQKLAEEKLKEASERKDEFLAMLAHELRNPLAPISSAAQLLKSLGGENAQVADYSDILIRQLRHLTDLVDDLLDVSRVTRGLIQLEREDADMKEIICDALEQARPAIESRRHMLEVRLPADSAIVHGDKTRLVQVIVNILTNASRYTPEGGKIKLVMEVADETVRISVTDTGYGIAPELLPYVFDLFTQGQRTLDRNQGGLGLGLALVKSITRLHGGWVSAQSEGENKGSTFTVTLPRLQKALEATGEPLKSVQAANEQAVQKSQDSLQWGQQRAKEEDLNLMIVDDNLDAANSLATLLAQKGQHVIVKGDGVSALEATAHEHIDAFILDIGMPGMDGYTLAKHLRAQPETANAVLIALTGYGQYEDRNTALQAGFDHHFVKPADTQLLLSALHIHAKVHAMQGERRGGPSPALH